MKIARFFAHWGLTENPFRAEEARRDTVFQRLDVRTCCHPDFDKILGEPDHPATSIVFGEKGSGKTAIRLQLATQIQAHNSANAQNRFEKLGFTEGVVGQVEMVKVRLGDVAHVLAHRSPVDVVGGYHHVCGQLMLDARIDVDRVRRREIARDQTRSLFEHFDVAQPQVGIIRIAKLLFQQRLHIGQNLQQVRAPEVRRTVRKVEGGE